MGKPPERRRCSVMNGRLGDIKARTRQIARSCRNGNETGRVDNHTIPLGDEDRGENPMQLMEILVVLHTTQGGKRDTQREREKKKKNSP